MGDPYLMSLPNQRVQQLSQHLQTTDPTLTSTMQEGVTTHAFDDILLAPPDAIFQLTARYKADSHPQKVNLGVGAYRDNNGKPWVLPVVKKAKALLQEQPDIDHEYLSIVGLPDFTKPSAKLIFGADSSAIKEDRVASVQTISGTGANHLGGLFLEKYYKPWNSKSGKDKIVYLSNPTWANHKAIFANIGCSTVDYPYYDKKTIGLDFDGYKSFLANKVEEGAVVLLHACAHNPTGVDPTREQWKEIAEIFKKRQLFAFFDCAYQGFASGDLDNDAWAVRHFISERIPLLVCQSYAKNAGLYGERIGCLNVVGKDAEEAKKILSQLSVLQRSEISNPPAFGGRIVSMLLNEPKMFEQWKEDVKTMSYRIIDMRKALYELLTNKLQTPGDWKHITNQIGMFSFTGLNPDQCNALVEKAHIYLTANGRISMAGLNTNNIEYVAECIDKVVRGQL